jgi:hypothetical protein
MLLWNLFVPSTAKGGIPLKINAGTVSKPPPPARVSKKLATIAVKNNRKSTCIESSGISTCISFVYRERITLLLKKIKHKF